MILHLSLGLVLLLLAGIGLPHPAGWGSDAQRACARVQLFVRSNGTHTDLVLAERELTHDWGAFLDLPARLTGVAVPEPRFLSFGWGEQTFYLEVKEWSDLTLGAAWRALFDSPGTVMHVELLGPIRAQDRMRGVAICKDDLTKLESYVRASFQDAGDRRASFVAPGYGPRDWFYRATGRYSPMSTSNTWTAEGLRTIAVATPLWGAFAGPILWHLPDTAASAQ